MRKILYSPGFGAGWTTWGGDTPEQKKFMLEYQPFIAFIEGGGQFDVKFGGDDKIEAHPLVVEFKAEWKRRWPEKIEIIDGKEYGYPYFGGLRDLQVKTVPVGARVRIDEYDGNESVAVEGANEDQWL